MQGFFRFIYIYIYKTHFTTLMTNILFLNILRVSLFV